jgi:uncharacterized protein DUF6092
MSEQGARPNPSAEGGPSLWDALDLLAYLVTAADLCRREPLHYGMFRLLDGASRLARALELAGAAAERPWIAELRQRIDADKELLMWDRPAFERLLQETAAFLALSMSEERERSRA